MNAIFKQQQQLLADQFEVMRRLQAGIEYSTGRLPSPLKNHHLDDPEVAERIAALNDRFTKLQDQFAGSMRHAHGMIGERYRSFLDVVSWAARENIISSPESWLELRALRNKLTHDYDLDTQGVLELVHALLSNTALVNDSIREFSNYCEHKGLLGQ